MDIQQFGEPARATADRFGDLHVWLDGSPWSLWFRADWLRVIAVSQPDLLDAVVPIDLHDTAAYSHGDGSFHPYRWTARDATADPTWLWEDDERMWPLGFRVNALGEHYGAARADDGGNWMVTTVAHLWTQDGEVSLGGVTTHLLFWVDENEDFVDDPSELLQLTVHHDHDGGS